MKAAGKTEKQKDVERRIFAILIPLFSAASAGFVGAILALFLGVYIEKLIGFRILWWHGLLIGLVIGFFKGWLEAGKRVRQSEEFSEGAAELGLQPLADNDVSRIVSELESMLHKDVSLHDCHFQTNEGTSLIMADMELEDEYENTDSNARPSRTMQTCAFIEFADFQFADFQLKPESTGLNLLGKIVGFKDIDFDDSPTFSKKYFLLGTSRGNVRRLFTRPVRDHFTDNLGLQVVAEKNRLVLFRPNQTYGKDEIQPFLQLAIATIEVLQQAGAEIPVESLELPFTKTTAIKQADELGGFVGALLRRQINSQTVEKSELDTALEQPIPRAVPTSLQKIFRADPFLMVFFSLFALGGFGVLLCGIFIPGEAHVKAIAVAVGTLVSILSFGIIALIKVFERRKLKMFADGKIILATIEKVSETPFVNGNERVFKVHFAPTANGSSQPATVNVQGFAAENAKRLCGTTIRILQDSKVPDRYLPIDCYAFD